MVRRERIVGAAGATVDQFWNDHKGKIIATAVVVGTGAVALYLVRSFLEGRRQKNEALKMQALNLPQFVEEAGVLGEDHGETVAEVASRLAELAGDDEELATALAAVAKLAGERRKK